jgi:hypothetical protein
MFIAVLAAAACTADAGPFGPDHGRHEVCADAESALRAPANAHPAWLADLFEHPINPEAGADDECSAAFVQREAHVSGAGLKNPAPLINHPSKRSSHETYHRSSFPRRIR